MKSCMLQAPSSRGSEGDYDTSWARRCEQRLRLRSLKNSKRERLAQVRLERSDVTGLTTKADVAVGPEQQQPIFVARAVARGERGARRHDAELEHRSIALGEPFEAGSQ